MAVVTELLGVEKNGTLCFGNYELDEKGKKDNFEVGGDVYKVKTWRDITKLEKNGMFVYESVPGSAVHDFSDEESGVRFRVEAPDDCEITLELAEETVYDVRVDGVDRGQMSTGLGGKLTLSLEMDPGAAKEIEVTPAAW